MINNDIRECMNNAQKRTNYSLYGQTGGFLKSALLALVLLVSSAQVNLASTLQAPSNPSIAASMANPPPQQKSPVTSNQGNLLQNLASFQVPFARVTNSATSQFSFNNGTSSKPFLPLPTNSWWQNLVLGDGSTQVACPPYLVRLPTSGRSRVEIGWPKLHVIEDAMWQVWIDDWQLSWDNNEQQPLKRQVTDFDDLSVTVEWPGGSQQAPNKPSDSWARQSLVKSTPYTTVEFQQMANVQLKTRHAILQFEVYSPNSWKVSLNSGQTWIIFVITNNIQDIRWQMDSNGTLDLQTKNPKGFTGVVRVAAVPDPINESLALLSKHHPSYPIGGTFTWQVEKAQGSDSSAKELAVTKFSYRRAGPNPSVPLLMLALPHHMHMLVSPQPDARAFSDGRGYRNSKGRMNAVVGNEWIMHDKAPEITWNDGINYSRLPTDWQANLVATLRSDVEHSKAPATTESYWFGKQVARLARLALMAEELNQPQLVDQLLDRIVEGLKPWLATTSSGNSAAFRYDQTNGGLLTPAGANGSLDADFGHPRYNDHHFHQGYFVYAAAVLARRRPNWWSTNQSAMLSVLLDYMCPSATSLKSPSPSAPFTRFRHFDVYEGHSWASGLIVFADNRNQESTSEAVNAYYAASLLASVAQQGELEVAARVLLAMELRAARTYWQMAPPPPVHTASPGKSNIYYVPDTTPASNSPNGPPSTRELLPWSTNAGANAGLGLDGDEMSNGQRVIYPAPYRHRGTTGVLWMTKMDYATWFGKQPEFIHGIQLIPFTPVSRQLFDRQWLQRIDGMLSDALTRPNPQIEAGWKGFLLMARAYMLTSKRDSAGIKAIWNQLMTMPAGNGIGDGWDDGNTKTNALSWVATCWQSTQ
ncbi:glycosyl hydrolase family 81-domain-containing protein [Syncephalis fuscata]|nr:glycosyl hydrolase family 81-domain-containing protein [Syncephalis fuscata]